MHSVPPNVGGAHPATGGRAPPNGNVPNIDGDLKQHAQENSGFYTDLGKDDAINKAFHAGRRSGAQHFMPRDTGMGGGGNQFGNQFHSSPPGPPRFSFYDEHGVPNGKQFMREPPSDMKYTGSATGDTLITRPRGFPCGMRPGGHTSIECES